MLNNNVLQFHCESYLGSEINEHIDFYLSELNEVYPYNKHKTSEKKKALDKLKVLKQNLKLEYDYFDKNVFREYSHFVSPEVNEYVGRINDAYIHILQSNSYEHLDSNLYDIQDYISMCTKFDPNKRYGNTYVTSIRELKPKSTNSELRVLNIILDFYNKPSKARAKSIINNLKQIEEMNFVSLLNENQINKYL